VLASGRVIALLHCNMKPDAKKQGGPLGTYAVFSDDHGKTWTRSPLKDVLHVPDNPLKKSEWGFWEPALVEHAPSKLLMLGRTTTGWLWESRSEDNGTTWSKPVQSTVPNPVAPPVLTRIPDTETLVLIHNPDVKLNDNWHGGERFALAFRTSKDSGRTWSAPTDIYRAPNNKLWVDYPAVRWIKGQLHLVWRHIDRGNPAGGLGGLSLYHHVLPSAAFEVLTGSKKSAESNAKPLRILPLGDSITRGSYLAQKDGKATGLPHPDGGGFRNGVSLDQLAAEQLGNETRFPSLALAMSNKGGPTLSYTRSGTPIPPDKSPRKLFEKLFVQGKPEEVAANVEALRQGSSLLDFVGGQTKRLNRTISKSDQ